MASMQVQLALQAWRDQRLNYQKAIKTVSAQLTKPMQKLPSSTFQLKSQELKEQIQDNCLQREDETFTQIYLYYVEGRSNISLMELANEMVGLFGGEVKFWQNKITDIAEYVFYHNELSIWQCHHGYQKYMPLSPQSLANLRKCRVLARSYIQHLVTLIKIIERAKQQADLAKIDQTFRKNKQKEEKYHAFLEETSQMYFEDTNVSTKGKNLAKNSLFLFLKPNTEKHNSLFNYNFKKEVASIQQSKMLKGDALARFEQTITRLLNGSGGLTSLQINSKTRRSEQKRLQSPPMIELTLDILRNEYLSFRSQKGKTCQQNHFTTIWDKQYYFSYQQHPVVLKDKEIDLTNPYVQYQWINYELNSEDEYGQLMAEDVGDSDQHSEESQVSNDSFVVSDGHTSDDDDKTGVAFNPQNYYKERWSTVFQADQVTPYGIKPVQGNSTLMPLIVNQLDQPLPIDSEELRDIIESKTRSQIQTALQTLKIPVSKSKMDYYLRKNFLRVRNKNKIIYISAQKNPRVQNGIQENYLQEETIGSVQDSCLEQTNECTYFQSADANSKRKFEEVQADDQCEA